MIPRFRTHSGSREAAERAGGPGSRTRAGGAAAKATGVAQALGDLAVLTLELLELAADVLSRLLCRGGHRRRPSGGRVWVWLRVERHNGDDGSGLGALV